MKNSKQPTPTCPGSRCMAGNGERWFADRLSITVPNPGKPLFLWLLLIIDQGSLLPRGAFCAQKTDIPSMISLVDRSTDRYGTPESLYADLGPVSASREFLGHLNSMGIKPGDFYKLRPGCRGYAENLMDSLRNYIWRAVCENPDLTAEDITAWLDRYLERFCSRLSEDRTEIRRRFQS